MTTMPILRGCGTRIAGGCYIEVRSAPGGHPVEEFICDPPLPINEAAIGMSARGMTYYESNGRSYLLDHVGSDYPNAADIIEEGRRHGFSRRIQQTLDFSKISPSTRLALVHPHAIIGHASVLLEHDIGSDAQPCPQIVGQRHCGRREPGHHGKHCARLWWQDIPNSRWDSATPEARKLAEIHIGSTYYYAWERPRALFVPSYQPGIIALLPISQVTVIRDREGGTHRRALERAENARITVSLEDA